MVLSTALTLGGATTAQAEMPFTMYLATPPENSKELKLNIPEYRSPLVAFAGCGGGGGGTQCAGF